MEEPAHRSWWNVELNVRPLPSQCSPRPGPVTDAEDPDLAALRRRVVDPVVRGMLRPHEVDRLSVHRGVDGRDGDVWVVLDTPGERYVDWLPSPWWRPEPHELDPPGSDEEIAAHLADRLQDWFAESSTGWGQLRPAVYELPVE
ncbi:hypothetical protein [Kineococcus sp. NPDC059986]|uniref:hypothetical protein n=1 Tax=Kineococcus sp. NPDC059986 TaxID=3155538 RepID=UPI00344B8547